MRILSRYVLLRFLLWFAATLVVLALGIIVAEMLLHLDDLAQDADGVLGALRFLVLRVCSYYLPILIPIASFAATYLSVGLAARWLEITAMKAGGVSPLRTCVPLLAAAAVLSGATLLVNETLVLQAERVWRRQLSGAEEQVQFRRGSFWYANGPYIFNVGDANPEQQTLHDVTIFEMNPSGRLVRRIEARLGRVPESGGLHLFDAVEYRFALAGPPRPPQREWHAEIMVDTTDRSPTLLDADAATLGLPSLHEFIDQRAAAGGSVTRFVAIFHRRLADPFSVFLLALLAVPFGLRVEQTRSLAVPALQGVAVLLLFWSLRSAGTLLAGSGPVLAVTMPWAVLGAFLAYGGWRFARVPR